MLDGKYLIKKGGMVMIPARIQHHLRDVWGDLHSWILPSTRNSSQAEAMEQPDHDIDIQLCPRVGAATKWRISFEGHGDVALVAEDLLDLVSKIP